MVGKKLQRVDRLLSLPDYRRAVQEIAEAEKERRYCRHTLQHFLDVARIAYILSLEEGGGLGKPIIYAAALLHDLGRTGPAGGDHALAGARLARRLLPQAGFQDAEADLIVLAIAGHRQAGPGLAGWLHRADRLARPCRECSVVSDCHRFPAGGQPPALEY